MVRMVQISSICSVLLSRQWKLTSVRWSPNLSAEKNWPIPEIWVLIAKKCPIVQLIAEISAPLLKTGQDQTRITGTKPLGGVLRVLKFPLVKKSTWRLLLEQLVLWTIPILALVQLKSGIKVHTYVNTPPPHPATAVKSRGPRSLAGLIA